MGVHYAVTWVAPSAVLLLGTVPVDPVYSHGGTDKLRGKPPHALLLHFNLPP